MPFIYYAFKDLAALTAILTVTVLSLYFVGSGFRRRQQNEMQRHLLDKFSSAKDFSDFVQSSAGQKYVMSFTSAVTSPRNPILNSVRIGIVSIFLGVGFYLLPMKAAAPLTDAVSILLVFLGLGFVISAVASHFVAKKLANEEKE